MRQQNCSGGTAFPLWSLAIAPAALASNTLARDHHPKRVHGHQDDIEKHHQDRAWALRQTRAPTCCTRRHGQLRSGLAPVLYLPKKLFIARSEIGSQPCIPLGKISEKWKLKRNVLQKKKSTAKRRHHAGGDALPAA
eukprot:1480541-Rhodomonas_salina.3